MSHAPLIVGLGGTLRPGSTSETALARALAAAEACGARTELFGGAFLAALPIYDPRLQGPNAERDRLLETIGHADGVIIASPGYHGSISGLVKNALDCLEDLREGQRPYLDGRAVGCIVTATGAQAGGSTLAALRAIVHALRGWPTPFGAMLGSNGLFDAAGAFADPRDAWQVETVAAQVVAFARAWSGCA
ncbi:MAG TPA: NAD(P)H-dependent oxidoreductase [Caulobacteraceae bacterium]|nr:NAD(P)H-dependent oxidoreductase [Caulobacteraceae bacterium]